MAEVNQGFEAAMRRGREFSAANDWAKALTEYIRAAQIVPNDITARYSLAFALYKLEQFDQAMQQFQGIVRNQPQNTDAWQRIAEIQHQTARTPEAIQTYQRILELHKKQQRQREAAEILREIIKTDPGQVFAYRELMDIAKAKGDRKTAAGIAVSLGRYFLLQDNRSDAASAVNEALVILPGFVDAENLKKELNGSSGLSSLPELPEWDSNARPAGNGNGNGQMAPASEMVSTVSAVEYTINQLIASAEEALARGDTGPALRNYEMAVETGANRADVFYSIGQLYAEVKQVDRATDYLRRSTIDPEYAASAYFSMGQLYAGAERLEEAAHAYRDALNLIDLQTIGKEEVDELITMYDALGDVLVAQGKADEAAELYNKLVAFVTNKGLRTDKAALAIIRARELNESIKPAVEANPLIAEDDDEPLTSSIKFGGEDGLSLFNENGENPPVGDVRTGTGRGAIGSFAGANGARLVVQPGPAIPSRYPTRLLDLEPNPQVLPYLRASEEFLRTRRLQAATDACHEMIRYFPDYVPAQAILAEVYVEQDRLEVARLKYQFIVDLYQLRQEPIKSVECYKRLGELSPDNMGLRTKLASLLLQYDQKEEAAEILLSTIGSYIKTGQLERALEECRRLRTLAPQNAAIRVQYAELLSRMEKHAEAMPELRRALELDNGNLKALALLNITSFLVGDSSLRWSSFQTVIERARQADTNLKQMLEEYRQANLLHTHAGLLYAQGCIYLENKQPKPAQRLFEQALEQLTYAPNQTEFEPLIHWTLGQLYIEQKQAEAAIEQFSLAANQADKADPANYAPATFAYGSLPSQIQLYRKLARAYHDQGNLPQAQKALKTVKKLMPFNREVHTELAELYFNQGQLSEALGELGELVAHYEEAGKIEQMIEVLREMVALAPNNIGVRDKLSEVYLKRGMIDDGLKEMDELAELQRKNGRLKDAVRTLQRAAETYWMMGKMEPAYELYDRIVRISPGDIEARQQLVNRHLMAGRITDAVEEQRTIAQICLQSNNTQEAIAALHQVIGLAPDDSRAYFQLAGVLTTINEHNQSYRLYQRVLRIDPSNDKAKALMEQAQRKAVEAGQL